MLSSQDTKPQRAASILDSIAGCCQSKPILVFEETPDAIYAQRASILKKTYALPDKLVYHKESDLPIFKVDLVWVVMAWHGLSTDEKATRKPSEE